MSDFDKQQVPEGSSEKKKMIVCGGLVAVLAAVLGIHFLKGGPQVAAASALTMNPTAATEHAAPPETAAQAEAALRDDPTASLLRGEKSEDPSWADVPRNPFRMTPEWHATLVRAEADTPEPSHLDAAPVHASLPVTVANFKLSGIFRQDQRLYAIINGNIVTAGMILDNAKVIDIRDDKVVLQRADSPTGPKATLTIEPKLK